MADDRVHLTSIRVSPRSVEVLEANIEASTTGPALVASRALGLLFGVGLAVVAYGVVVWSAIGYIRDPSNGIYWVAGGLGLVFALITTPIALQVLAFERRLGRRSV